MERITSRKNARIQHLKKLGASKAYRTECGEFLCDGEKLLEEAVSNGMTVVSVLYCGEAPEGAKAAENVYETQRDIIEYVSPMKSPQNVLFTCRMQSDSFIPRPGEKYIVLEEVQDPGNVGTVMRTARAMGYDCVLLLPGCADVFSPKAVRATMGAVFRQRVCSINYDSIAAMKSLGVEIYGAALAADSRDIRNVDFNSFAVCIGSEGRGLSDGLIQMCDEKIIIPMMQDCESLNAAMAAGIIMWESVR